MESKETEVAAEAPAAVKCVRCGGVLKEGWIPDYSYATILLNTWVEGKPQKNWLSGHKTPPEEKTRNVVAYRCDACGHLEFYAR